MQNETGRPDFSGQDTRERSSEWHEPRQEKPFQQFSLLSLLVVIAGVGIGMALLLPVLTRSQLAANEASAVGSLRAIRAAQADYNNSSTFHTYSPSLESLRSGKGAGDLRYIGDDIGSGLKSGYRLSLTAGCKILIGSDPEKPAFSRSCWSAEAHPVEYGLTGFRSFYIDETGILLESDIGGLPGHELMPEI